MRELTREVYQVQVPMDILSPFWGLQSLKNIEKSRISAEYIYIVINERTKEDCRQLQVDANIFLEHNFCQHD